MRSTLAFLAIATVLIAAASAANPGSNQRILVLVDDSSTQFTHSLFFSGLKARGHTLTFAKADDASLSITKFGEYLYDSLIIFSPRVEEFGGTVDVSSILEFIDDGHSVILAGSSDLSEPMRELASEVGVQFGDDRAAVIDHVNYDASDASGDHTLVVSNNFVNNKVIMGEGKQDPVLFQGIGHKVVAGNRLVVPVLRGSSTSYTHVPDAAIEASSFFTAGSDTLLISALHARNNARVLVSGSVDFFSDKFANSAANVAGNKALSSARSGNARAAEQLGLWALGERGVLTIKSVSHHREGVDEPNPTQYRIKDDIVFTAVITEFDGVKEVPYQADDVQLEVQMLDPYIRTNLKANKKGEFTANIKLPDVYGVFTFKLNYKRQGYTSVHFNEQVTIRPFRHNEYERYIPAAYPYYASAFSMMFGFFLFGIVFLYNKTDKPKSD